MIIGHWSFYMDIQKERGSWDSLLVEHQSRNWKVVSSHPDRCGSRTFFSRANFLCSYSVSIQPCVTAVACKRPWSFCQKCRWQVTPKHAYTLDPGKSEWADNASKGTYQGNKLTCNSSGNTQPQSSQLAEPLWTNSGIKSGISVRELIPT